MAKAWISLARFAEAIVSKDGIFIVRCNIGALFKGWYGSLHGEEMTHDRSHLGA